MRRVAVILALLVCLPGCSALLPTGETGPTTPTATAAPVPGDESGLPPGVEADGVNATVLADTTGRAVRSESVRLRFDEREARPEFSLGTIYVGPRVSVEAAAADRYTVRVEEVSERGGGLSIATFENATYVTPGAAYRFDGENVTRVTANGTAGRPARLVRGYVRTFLDVREAEVSALGNGSVLVEGEGGPSVDGTDYSVRAMVDEDGVVRSFRAIYTRDDRVQFASFSLRASDGFEPPAWYESAATGERDATEATTESETRTRTAAATRTRP